MSYDDKLMHMVLNMFCISLVVCSLFRWTKLSCYYHI